MKQLLILLLTLTLLSQNATAQTSKPPKEMIQQIAALKIFLKYARQGYSIVSGGLRTVNNIKNGDFNLHDLQFDHLKQVSPSVTRYTALSGLTLSHIRLLLTCNKLLRQIGQQNILTKEEQVFCKGSVTMMMNVCKQYVDELTLLVTANDLELKDDERINRISQLKQMTIRLESSVRSLSEELQLLTQNRINEQHAIQHSKQLNNLK
ncbi:hypothetical protein IQ13_4235 [Lacibacter cauensis]|uniref:Uncharacterized protein n=1 Tax=Lacibacter cauensis TaxID=510947 RepID=A0A562S9B7_9BACT|nr:hypothetical protein [Lacibacter cauensis]TWI77991.1 hypothetical protein IQ13_4235 [Lacibacter cauensis]